MNAPVSKASIVRDMCTRAEGASMREIIAATGGPHYNELRRLAAQGYAIRKVKQGNETRYFATPPARQSFEATVTSQGQVTIPKEVRERLQLRGGHKLQFVLENGDRAVITPVATRLSDLAGMLGKPKRSATLEEMDAAIGRAAADRYLRAVGRKR